jgi:predicted nucleotidyltransferase
MTTVYPWKTLLRKGVITQERFQAVKQEVLGILRKLYERGWIKSACIYGSTARGDASLGSDLDVLIISDPKKEKAVQRYARRIIALGHEETVVPVSVLHFNSAEARSGRHSISPSIFQHVLHTISPATMVGVSPSKLVRFNKKFLPHVQASLANVRVMDARAEQMREGILRSQRSAAYFSYLARIIGQPIHSARNAIEAVRPQLLYGQQEPDSPEWIVEQYEQLFFKRFPGSVRALKRVLCARQEYKQALWDAINAIQEGDSAKIQKTKTVYNAAIRHIEDVASDRLEILKTNSVIAAQQLKRTPKRLRISEKRRRK